MSFCWQLCLVLKCVVHKDIYLDSCEGPTDGPPVCVGCIWYTKPLYKKGERNANRNQECERGNTSFYVIHPSQAPSVSGGCREVSGSLISGRIRNSDGARGPPHHTKQHTSHFILIVCTATYLPERGNTSLASCLRDSRGRRNGQHAPLCSGCSWAPSSRFKSLNLQHGVLLFLPFLFISFQSRKVEMMLTTPTLFAISVARC